MASRQSGTQRRKDAKTLRKHFSSASLRLCVFALSFAYLVAAEETPPPLVPEAALKTIRTKPDLRVELVAAEPLVQSPVAIDWDAQGRLWVVEMFDYPMGVDGNWKPGGRVKMLDGTGKARVFIDGLPFPTGLLVVSNGVYICAAPDILFAQDTDGDGKADRVRTNYTGFATHNYQARVNGLVWGLDGWIYGSSGLFGGKIKNLLTGESVDLSGRDFRFHPQSGAIEPAAGISQMGRVCDDYGNWFGNDNSTLLWHYPLPEHYARRNPHVTYPEPKVSVARGKDPNKLFPISRTLERFNDPQMANRVTSACGPEIYRGTALGSNYYGNAFVCEPVHNLVTRLVLRPDGATFAGERAPDEQNREFLASTDNWFRPVQVRTGPDGALWVVDMYRFVVEHPRWISQDRLKQLDVRAGADKGRIYRITAKEPKPFIKPIRILPEHQRFERALELGDAASPGAAEELARIAEAAKDQWTRAAVLSSASNHLKRLLATEAPELLPGLIQSAVGFGRIDLLADVRLDAKLAATLLDALDRKDAGWQKACPPKLATQVEALIANATNPALMVRDSRSLSRDIERLADALPDKSALARLRQLKTPQVASTLISKWPQFSPSIRANLIPLLLERETWKAELAKAIDAGTILPAEIPLDQRKRLPGIFATPTNRLTILREYDGVASLKPQAGNGAELFETHCATCHAHGGRGFAVGPNLAEFAGKTVQDFLLAIIDPNAAVDPKFVAYDLETKDGRSLSGIVKNETASALTLVQAGGLTETVLRSAIKEMRPLRLSLMPEGLEQTLPPQDMADLIAWIKHPN